VHLERPCVIFTTAWLWPHYELDTWVDVLGNWVALRTSLSAGQGVGLLNT